MFKDKENREFVLGSMLVACLLLLISKSSPAGAWLVSMFGTVSKGFVIVVAICLLLAFGGSIIGAILKFFQD